TSPTTSDSVTCFEYQVGGGKGWVTLFLLKTTPESTMTGLLRTDSSLVIHSVSLSFFLSYLLTPFRGVKRAIQTTCQTTGTRCTSLIMLALTTSSVELLATA
ncbi:hypothetical protein LINGRAHAP2_LOCUS34557, partial [Linum grandiflorum]